MSLTKRRISRRALGVVVGASLLVLGLEAPAFAATTVTGFNPTSGPAAGGCVLVVTGSGFALSPEANTTVNFVNTVGGALVPATAVTIISDTELWATAPALGTGTSHTIRVDNLQGTGTASTQTYTAVTGAGTCGPTIASFTPDCGSVGDVVKITGTNLLAADHSGGLVEFSPFVAGDGVDASPTNPDISDPVTLQVTVPTGSTDGPISVTTFTGSEVFSSTAFDRPPPDCTVGPTTHARSISLSLKKHLIAKGAVTVADDTAECMAGVPVKIQRRKKGGGWKNVGSTTTSDAGKYKRAIKDRPGKYRALAPAVTLADTSVCSKDVSPRVRHSH